MHQVATIKYLDREFNDEAFMFVRTGDGVVALGHALLRNGDFEVFFGVNELDQLIDALHKARALIETGI